MEQIWKAGIRGRMFDLIMEIYRENHAEVRLNDEKTRKFETTTGVRQGVCVKCGPI